MAARRVSWTLSILLVLLTEQALVKVPVPDTKENFGHSSTKRNIVQLLEMIENERNIRYLVLYNTKWNGEDVGSPFHDLLSELRFPIILAGPKTMQKYKSKLSKETLVLLSDSHPKDEIAFNLSITLQELQHARFLVYTELRGDLEKQDLLRACCIKWFSFEIYNILLLLPDFGSTSIYYGCSKYSPNKSLYRAKFLNKSTIIYKNQFLNMYGGTLAVYLYELPPRTKLLTGKNGEPYLDGYVGKLFTTFAKRRNASIAYKNTEIFEISLNGILKNVSVDLWSMIGNNMMSTQLDDNTYPYEISRYCAMIPLPDSIPTSEIFIHIIQTKVLLIILVLIVLYAVLLLYSLHRSFKKLNFVDVFLNDKSLRGILGQPFTLVAEPSFNTKLICFVLCYTSLLINTTYQAYLQSSLTRPPTKPAVRSYSDMENSGLKLFVYHPDLTEYLSRTTRQEIGKTFKDLERLFKTTDNYTTFLNMRYSMNTNYGYPVSTTLWQIFTEQQKRLPRPLYCLSTEICLKPYSFLSVPIRVDLPYRDLFEHHILQIHHSGLFMYWVSRNFYNMLNWNLTGFRDLDLTERHGGPITIIDLYWIWWMYLLCIIFCVLGFLWELAKWKFDLRTRYFM